MIVKPVMPAYGGYTIVRDEKVILIKGAIPGELVDIEIGEKKRDYSIANVKQVIEPSEFRVDPQCSVFGLCGGCHLQFISYEKQLNMKEEILLDSLNRLGKIEIQLGPSFSDNQWHYRHRSQFKISKKGEVGFFKESSRDVVVFDSCPLMKKEINYLLSRIKLKSLADNLREIHISSGDKPVAHLRGDAISADLPGKFIEAGFSGVACNDDTAPDGAFTTFDLNGLHYTVSPRTFFQSHWSLNTSVIDFIIERMMPPEFNIAGKRVLDLYAGAGNFSLPLAVSAGEVIAVEENSYAIEDGARNLKLNKIKNCKFVRSTAEKYKINGKFDLIILDPPRPGLTSDVTKKILENPPSSIVYISCNPATLARDLKKMKDKYEIQSVHMIDFFPNTFHIEAVSFLRLK